MVAGQSGAREGQGAVRPAICTAGVPAAEMACRVDPGTSVVGGRDIQNNWATDFGSMVSGGGCDEAREAEDILGAITSGGGNRGSDVSCLESFFTDVLLACLTKVRC
jgi:hypothetical protein